MMTNLFGFETSAATISACGRYRYTLERRWEPDGDRVMFLMLNPSTADAHQDDPTIRRCIGYARRWGFSGLCVGNLFAYRATDPRELKRAADPIGPDNDEWLSRLASSSALVVAAWGNGGSLMGRSWDVSRAIKGMHALRVSRQAEPCHPLYLPADLEPFPISDPAFAVTADML
jgi:hypothetical protein